MIPVILPEQYRSNYDYFYQFAKELNKISCVVFSLHAAKLCVDSNQQTNDCIILVEKWLKEPGSVSKKRITQCL